MFWPIVGKHLIDCFNYAHDHGALSNSQKQALITLLEKKGKDKRLIKNWRPISLINVDAKIACKCKCCINYFKKNIKKKKKKKKHCLTL